MADSDFLTPVKVRRFSSSKNQRTKMHPLDTQRNTLCATPHFRQLHCLISKGLCVPLLVVAGLSPIATFAATSLTAVSIPAIGSSIYDPNTGITETVTSNSITSTVLQGYVVQVSNGDLIFAPNAVDQSFTGSNGNTWYVTAVTKDASGNVTSVTAADCGKAGATYSDCTGVTNPTTNTQNLFIGNQPSLSNGTAGTGSTTYTPTTASGDQHVYSDLRTGSNGSNGSDGGGFCVSKWLGGWCIQWSPTAGGAGASGPDITDVIPSTWGNIITVSPNLPGIAVGSTGGDGGTGGSYIGINGTGAPGGAGGPGGNVTVTNYTNVTTNGENAYGMFVKSSAGAGGTGGTGYIASGGGTGGSPAQAGNVNVTDYGDITTYGDGAIGLLAESLGGSGGNGGGSYGLVSEGGGGSAGGNGGTVAVTLTGPSILTFGEGAHGVLAQSIGGSGGNAGSSAGIASFGVSGAYGGDGSTVHVSANGNSTVTTLGDGAIGLFAQSIGGGGGSGGYSIGLASMGASGGGGGAGGNVYVDVAAGAKISTGVVYPAGSPYAGQVKGGSSHDIFAQSVGGGGGASGVAAGAVAFGASGGSGGEGGAVSVDTAGTLYAGGRDARGVFAQSVGGGGGAALGTGGLVSLGGGGGGGANGGAVSVIQRSSGSIVTKGIGGDGIFAQSVGGGGGSGSSSGGLVALGGSGSGGGNGGSVSINNAGSVSTSGDLAHGLFAQSVGGGGGSGGNSGGLVSMGGSGSGASGGSTVTVTNTGAISTQGSQSAAIEAQSIGGGGGDGGSAGGGFSFGGSAGAGGTGGNVTVNNAGTITTGFGTNPLLSAGILAQSIGGGGGNGGGAVSAGSFALSMGGTGGAGGNGGNVSVGLVNGNGGNINTYGDHSVGILAQSIGGGGGNGGSAVTMTGGNFTMGLGIGGGGATGGTSGSVGVTTNGSISTNGVDSDGIFAQSIGGGGGNGGSSVVLSASSTSLNASIGGSGGSGAASCGALNGGNCVSVNSTGSIDTQGEGSDGIFAQSIGGGGGNGGMAITGSVGFNSLGVTIGGSAGNGAAGSSVGVQQQGDINTRSDNANGIVAQSIGGGGGNGGMAIGGSLSANNLSASVGGGGGAGSTGANVTVVDVGNLSTQGINSNGILAQSIGGGGGNGGASLGAHVSNNGLSASIGGNGGAGGNAQLVSVTQSGNLSTLGASSAGILAQSIGGGGGNGGYVVNGQVSQIAGSFSMGGKGAGGGTGGAVNVTTNGGTTGMSVTSNGTDYGNLWTLVTGGENAAGIIAQSIGGGGGNGGLAGNLVAGRIALGAAVSGSGGAAGSGAAVTVHTGSSQVENIFTAGNNSVGILAQSVGGGGGNGGLAGNLSAGSVALGCAVGSQGGNGGSGSSVSLTSVGSVTTLGNLSDGLIAQSIGGGGGNGGMAVSAALGSLGATASVGGSGNGGGNGGAVSLNSTGGVTTHGNFATGLLSQSVGGGGGNGGASVAFAGSVKGSISAAIGGSGAGGGDSGKAGMVNAGDVSTFGFGSAGLLAQSIGGGGGNGGFAGSGSFSVQNGSAAIGVGGSGATGGSSCGGVPSVDCVTVDSTGNIVTHSGNSVGILAQSIGGGGGNGGNVIALSGSQGFSGAVSIGGFAGAGGNAGGVSVTNNGSVVTAGVGSDGIQSTGILAQSIGGGGGNGGFALSGSLALGTAGLSASLGGSGGAGGSAGVVNVYSNCGSNPTPSCIANQSPSSNTATIQTQGVYANGIEAQSIGGGGGNGGFSGAIDASANTKASLGLSIGGHGGSGGGSNAVGVYSVDNILTADEGSNGILAQSIGGGGGNGGMSLTGLFSATNTTAVNLSASVGGFAGSGANASTVNVASSGSIQTGGDRASGVLAQSIGGNGGNGGLSVDASISLSAQNANNIAASVGGFGGSGGYASNVSVTRAGTTRTTGDSAAAIEAQSIGGSGGNGGLSIVGSFNGTDSKSLTASVGGFGGTGSQAGSVTVVNTGDIATGSLNTITVPEYDLTTASLVSKDITFATGRDSAGILAQSIGGGGGNGGLSIAGGIGVSKESTSLNAGVTVGGFGGDGGYASAVNVTDNGAITTFGDNAGGIVAQSIGGGGGNGGGAITGLLGLGATSATGQTKPVNLSFAVGGFGGKGNYADQVTVDQQSGSIYTQGASSSGILAQSIGGGGGTGGNGHSISLQFASECSGGTGCEDTSKNTGKNFQATLGGFGGTGANAGAVDVHNGGVIQTLGDSSEGITAQSIGGGGGTAGNATMGTNGLVPTAAQSAVSGLLALANKFYGGTKTNGSLMVGGFGGASGNGQTIQVTNDGLIATSGQQSSAIHATSIGGGGGTGGNASGAETVAIGGWGGASGNGAAVNVTNTAVLSTTGVTSAGILAESFGGGGGDGGAGGATMLSIGGWGKVGGTGGTVGVNNNGIIATQGDMAAGIQAQSIGGGGGNCGNAGGSGVFPGVVSLGGWGGTSGAGGDVSVTNKVDGAIATTGTAASAISAQSIGGGGGNGGTSKGLLAIGGGSGAQNNSVSQTFNTLGSEVLGSITSTLSTLTGGSTPTTSFTGSLATGSSGSGGHVLVGNAASLWTSGDLSNGILAQSIGGGGGFGGRTVGLVNIGGAGGTGGSGGAVDVTNEATGTIWVTGNQSNGIFAQSIGGGGGQGGEAAGLLNVLANKVYDFSSLPTFALNLGANNGGSSGDGGAVTVANAGQIETDGLQAQAIMAQSIGGGGGNGGAVGLTTTSGAARLDMTLGGQGGAGGSGGAVTVTNNTGASLYTKGASSTAIFAQSVGGGGGNGAGALVGNGGTQTIVMGGSGGIGGNGGDVSVTNNGAITIAGDNSVAIMAQSVGGGGGTANPAAGASTSVTLGGASGANGTGGDVSVINDGAIHITGNNSVGIFAQSVGGGGGAVLPGGGASGLTLANGNTGTGGTVTVTNNASNIVLSGENDVAMFVQSVGGGGGAVGLSSATPGQMGAFQFAGTAGGTGVAANTVVNQTGNLVSLGNNSVALAIQSNGGSGNGAMTVNIINSGGAFDPTSFDPNTMNALSGVSFIAGGGGSGSGISLLDGINGATSASSTNWNEINNAGIVTNTLGVNGYAVMAYGVGSNRINNTGVMVGSIDLGDAIINNGSSTNSTAIYDSGAVVDLVGTNPTTDASIAPNASTDFLMNYAYLYPGSVDNVMTTNLYGYFTQTSTGTLGIDLDLASQTSDQIASTGGAILDGTLVMNIMNPGQAMPGMRTATFLTASQGITDNGLSLITVPSAVATYSLDAAAGTVNYNINFSPAQLTQNQQSVGSVINAIQSGRVSPAFTPIAAALFYQPDNASLGSAYDALSGEGTADWEQPALMSNDLVMNTIGQKVDDWLNSQNQGEGSTTASSAHQGGTSEQPGKRDADVWITGYGGSGSLGGDAWRGTDGVQYGNSGMMVGLNGHVSSDWFAGAAIGAMSSSYSAVQRNSGGSFNSTNLALYGAWRGNDGNYALGAFNYGWYRNSENRFASVSGISLPNQGGVSIPVVSGFSESLSGHFHSNVYSFRLEGGKQLSLHDGLALKPFVAAQPALLNMQGFTETQSNGSASVIGLSYADHNVYSVPLYLGSRLDFTQDLGEERSLRGWLGVSWKHEFADRRTAVGSFIAAPGYSFTIDGAAAPTDSADVEAGMSVQLGANVSFFAHVRGNYAPSSHYTAASAGLDVRW